MDFYIVFLVYLFAIPELQSNCMIGKVTNVEDMFKIKEKNLLPFELRISKNPFIV